MGETEIDIVGALFDMPLINAAADDAAAFTSSIALVIAPFFYAVDFVWNFGYHTVDNAGKAQPKFFDKKPLVGGLLIWFLMLLYVPIFGSVRDLVEVINKSTSPSNYVEWKVKHSQLISPVEGKTKEVDDTDKREEDEKGKENSSSLIDAVGAIQYLTVSSKEFFENIGVVLMQSTFSILGFVVSIVIDGLTIIMSRVFYIIGPLALLFSMLTMFRDKMSKWFGMWLLLLFNPMTTNLLSALIMSMTVASMTDAVDGSYTYTTGLGVIIFNLIIILCYILSFWVTGFFVGSPDAGKVLSTAGAIASDVASGGALSQAGKGIAGAATSALDSFKGTGKGGATDIIESMGKK